MYSIYEHVTPSGKRYIGQTCQRLSRRWRNGNGYLRNEYFHRAIIKYGWDNIQHNVICECETLEEANKVEAELIEEFKTNDPKYGYNISGGADGKGHIAPSTKMKLSEKGKGRFAGKTNPNYGRKHTSEERRKMSEFQKEYFATHRSPRLGTKASEESRKKMSESRKNSEKVQAFIRALNKSKAKAVRCIEKGEIYESAREAARVFGFSQGNISAACRGVQKQAYGYHWEYV